MIFDCGLNTVLNRKERGERKGYKDSPDSEPSDNIIDEDSIPLYQKFKSENPQYWHQTECRMISYWNEYYRRMDAKLNDYIGYRLFQKLK